MALATGTHWVKKRHLRELTARVVVNPLRLPSYLNSMGLGQKICEVPEDTPCLIKSLFEE